MKKKHNKKLRNFVWTMAGILLMAVFVVAVTSISDTSFTTTGTVTTTGDSNLSDGTMFINAISGLVGIGTMNPTNKLHVVTAGNPAKFESTSGNGRIEIDAPSTKNAGVQFFENNSLRWGIFNQGTDDSLKFQNKDFATRLVVQQEGNVGIGITTPQYKLEVVGNVSLNNTLFVTTGGNVGIGTSTPLIDLAIGDADTGLKQISDGVLTIFTNNAERMRVESDGRVFFSSSISSGLAQNLALNSGSFELVRDTSDERLKTITGDFDKGLDEIMGIEPKKFYFNNDENQTIYGGLIAQNVQEFIPKAVGADADGYLYLRKITLVASTINAIQEQQSQIEELKAENDLLKDRLTQIEERLDSKELICQI